MTPQQIFDKAVNGIRAQGGPSVTFSDASSSCRYRINGRKCAAGHIITDTEYKDDMEGRIFRHVVQEYKLDHLMENLELISKLQAAHDRPFDMIRQGVGKDPIYPRPSDEEFFAKFEASVEDIADYNGLTYRRPDVTPSRT